MRYLDFLSPDWQALFDTSNYFIISSQTLALRRSRVMASGMDFLMDFMDLMDLMDGWGARPADLVQDLRRGLSRLERQTPIQA